MHRCGSTLISKYGTRISSEDEHGDESSLEQDAKANDEVIYFFCFFPYESDLQTFLMFKLWFVISMTKLF